MELKLHSTLICFHSKRDKWGNCYWAFRFVDHLTGTDVVGKFSGGDSNVYAVLRHWNVPNDWDRGIQFFKIEKGIREFKELTKSWSYAGCNPEDIALFIRTSLDFKNSICSSNKTGKTNGCSKGDS